MKTLKYYLVLLISAFISGTPMVTEENPLPYTAGNRTTGNIDGDTIPLPVTSATVLPPQTGIAADRPDPTAVALRDTGSGAVRTHAWNPGLHRYNNAERATGMSVYYPGIVADVRKEHNGTSTRLWERCAREGTSHPLTYREHRSDTPRFSPIPGNGGDKTQVQYFTGCSDGSENSDCTAPGIMPPVMSYPGCTGLPAITIMSDPLATRSGFSESLVALTEITGDLSLPYLEQEVSVLRIF